MEFLKLIAPHIVPLLQTLTWVTLIGATILFFRKDIRLLLGETRERIKNGGGFELGPLKLLEQRVNEVRGEMDVAQSFLLSMGDDMYGNLKKLASDDFGPYELHEKSGLERELYHLRAIGYIKVRSIRGIPRSGDDLSQHVRATDVGKRFVELREKHANRMARAPSQPPTVLQ